MFYKGLKWCCSVHKMKFGSCEAVEVVRGKWASKTSISWPLNSIGTGQPTAMNGLGLSP